eukprot:scaffold10375_cov123-Skeletonema_menzelii.AAC.7
MPRNTITAAVFPLLLLLLSIASSAYGFTAAPNNGVSMMMTTTTRHAASSSSSAGGDPNEIIARKIIVCGDVDGGYYRSCVKNEGGRFRKLIGTMTPPDDSKRAEILIEVSY